MMRVSDDVLTDSAVNVFKRGKFIEVEGIKRGYGRMRIRMIVFAKNPSIEIQVCFANFETTVNVVF